MQALFSSEGLQYAAFFAHGASFTRVITLLFLERGFTASQIGIFSAGPKAITTLLTPFCAAYVDHAKNARLPYLWSIVFSILPFLSLLFTGNDFKATLLALVIISVTRVPQMALTDALVLTMAGEYTKKWGHARAWGATTWGLINLITAFSMELFGVDAMFSVIILTAVLLWTVSLWLPVSCSDAKTEVSAARIWRIFSQSTQSVAFFVNLTFLGAGFSMVECLLFLALDRELHASKVLCGLSVLTTVVFELPIFANAEYLLHRFGTSGLIALGQMAWIIRALFYSWMPEPNYVLFIEPLHGVTFALVWTAAVTHSRNLAPAGLEASAQGILNFTFMGIGRWVGDVCGGYLFDTLGYRITFIAFAALIFISLIGYVCITHRTKAQTGATIEIEIGGSSIGKESEQLSPTYKPRKLAESTSIKKGTHTSFAPLKTGEAADEELQNDN